VNPVSQQEESKTVLASKSERGEFKYRALVFPVPDGTPRPLRVGDDPTYNCAKYLRETLASVLAQDRGAEEMQIEVLDDCSSCSEQPRNSKTGATRKSIRGY